MTYTPMVRPDGSRMTFKERQAIRRETESQKFQPREVPAPIAVTLGERQSIRLAEREGQRMAVERAKARERARLEALGDGPTNVYRDLLSRNMRRYNPATADGRKRRAELEAKAIERDAEIERELAEQAKAETLANDPTIKNAIESAELELKAAQPEDREARAELLAIAKEGETQLYWERCRELDRQIWSREDAKLNEHNVKTAAELELREQQAAIVQAAKERLENSETQQPAE